MRTFNFDLSSYDGVSGKLELAIPTYRERLKMIKECNFKLDSEGQVTVGVDSIDSMVKMLEVCIPYFKKVDVKHGEKIHAKSFEDLEQYSEFDGLLSDAASSVMNAGRLGN